MRGRNWAIAIAAAFTLGCAGADVERADKAPRKLRVAYSRHISWAPIYIAQAEGFFAQEGLEIEPVTAMRPEETLVALITGDIDIRPGPLHAGFLSSVAQGAPIRLTAGMTILGTGCTYFGIVVGPRIDTTGTPKIRRMRSGQDGASRYIVTNMLATRNVSIKDIETVRLPESVMAMGLESGSMDAVAVSEPALSRLSKIGKLWLSGQDALPGFQWSVLAFGERLLVRERETGLRFMQAYERGMTQYRQGKTDRNVAIIAEATGETPEVIREVCWPEFSPENRLDWASISAFQKWANAEGLMERTLTREQAYDSAFVSAVARKSGLPE